MSVFFSLSTDSIRYLLAGFTMVHIMSVLQATKTTIIHVSFCDQNTYSPYPFREFDKHLKTAS